MMMAPDRYTIRRVVNDLVDKLIDEGVEKKDILEMLDLYDSDLEYFDLEWLNKDD